LAQKTDRRSRVLSSLATVLLAVGASLSGFASTETDSDLIVAHLEFLGYTCDLVDQGIRARHSTKFHLLVIPAHDGILLQTGFPGRRESREEPTRYAILNNVNARARVARFFWTPEGHLFGSAWMPGAYEKARFAAFMDAWEQDALLLREVSGVLQPFLNR
jgi:hypothetical protein